MGHDILGYNKSGENVAYLRFSKNDVNSLVVYCLLESSDYFAGVSGTGDSVSFTQQQMEKALENYNRHMIIYPGKKHFETWQRNEILKFLKNCLEMTKKERTIQVLFG
ncbi:hypothetical protein [Lentibacillus cibarius]|uniref:Uncharacterized protein n=1 Tax=Lentibacillus cibarius TaxID=2583219 RepID=A0A5S3QND4_9BACI|nr:hypothetical protein [Lentibacillus cibarius]TMN22731.1 hypothetical protein FFL34_11960 [Lentibacillus cibarius]